MEIQMLHPKRKNRQVIKVFHFPQCTWKSADLSVTVWVKRAPIHYPFHVDLMQLLALCKISRLEADRIWLIQVCIRPSLGTARKKFDSHVTQLLYYAVRSDWLGFQRDRDSNLVLPCTNRTEEIDNKNPFPSVLGFVFVIDQTCSV